MPDVLAPPSSTLVATERIVRCPLCGSGNWKPWRLGRDRLLTVSGQQFAYGRCRDCRLVFQSERPVEDAIGRFYPDTYGPYERAGPAPPDNGSPPPLVRSLKRVNRSLQKALAAFDGACTRGYRRAYQRYYAVPREGATLLDFGCGSDRFLNEARAGGWRTVGVDFSPAVVERVRRSGHDAYLAGDEAWSALPDASIDLVRLHHVLEHLYAPVEVLIRLRRTLRPGGLIHIGVPNPGSLTSYVFRARWVGLDCPRHIMLYTPGRLCSLLCELGFREPRVLQETVTNYLARSLAYLLVDWKLLARSAIPILAGNAVLGGVNYLPMRAAAAVGLGDRFNVFARV